MKNTIPRYLCKKNKVLVYDDAILASFTRRQFNSQQMSETDQIVYYVSPNGTKQYTRNGKLHRTDGPVIEHADGTKMWYIDGLEYTEEQFNQKEANMNEEKLGLPQPCI